MGIDTNNNRGGGGGGSKEKHLDITVMIIRGGNGFICLENNGIMQKNYINKS